MLVKLSQVTKIYKMDGFKIRALDSINLTIEKGEFVSLLGPSGSGKSTLMYIIGCLDSPTSGSVIFDGEDVGKLGPSQLAKIRNQKVGFVFQTFNLLPRTSALSNVELPLVYAGLISEKRKEKARQILKMLGLGDRLFHSPAQLSGGQQQKVAIARALVNNPDLILADEPTGNLDSKSGREIMEILKNLNRKGRTIIVVTHNKDIAKYTQRIMRIKDGKIAR